MEESLISLACPPQLVESWLIEYLNGNGWKFGSEPVPSELRSDGVTSIFNARKSEWNKLGSRTVASMSIILASGSVSGPATSSVVQCRLAKEHGGPFVDSGWYGKRKVKTYQKEVEEFLQAKLCSTNPADIVANQWRPGV